jgi:hypothetical protein
MGIDSLLQQNMQNAGLAGSDQLARNAMFPQSQMDKTQYAVSSQLPTGAETLRSDYDTPTDAYTGLTTPSFAQGGIAALRYDDGGGISAEEMLNQNNQANAEPAPPPTMAELADQLNTAYRTNSNYDQLWKDFEATKQQDPAEWYRHQLGFLGGQQGWQIGQNTGERNAAFQPQVNDTMAQAQAAGLSPDEIQQILGGSSQNARNTNVQRIANQKAEGGDGVFSGLGQAAPMFAAVAAMALAPELAPLLAPELGAFGGALASGALTGGALGGIGAASTGKDIGRGALMGGVTGAAGAGLGGALSGIDPSLGQGLQGLKAANSVYNVVQGGGQNIGADINAAKGIYNLSNTMTAAQGGLMSGGGIANLGSYSDGGQLLKGPGDGMSDNIPAKIGSHQPARLADGEFVIPADVVSHLGNGSTDAGAKQLYKMMDRIRHARTGNKKQGKQINASKFLPQG